MSVELYNDGTVKLFDKNGDEIRVIGPGGRQIPLKMVSAPPSEHITLIRRMAALIRVYCPSEHNVNCSYRKALQTYQAGDKKVGVCTCKFCEVESVLSEVRGLNK